MRDIAVFSGSAHPELAAEICAHLGAPLLPVEVKRFANDCLEVQLRANCRERDVFLIQPDGVKAAAPGDHLDQLGMTQLPQGADAQQAVLSQQRLQC